MELEITLQSDLCVSSGKHYSSIIDLDTSLDEYGLPFIPARRLKGCLKDAASMFADSKVIEAVFGKSGSSDSGALVITDARLEEYEAYVSDISAHNADSEDVADLFCTVRAMTAINEETNTAKDKSLRFIRVVNQFSPVDDKPLKFIANVTVDEKYKNDVMNFAKALKNIGFNRNRGLGAVKCEIIDKRKEKEAFPEFDNIEPDSMYTLKYTVKAEGDIMLPDNSADCTLDYIPGTSVLGAFASLYCKNGGDMDKFNEMFYSKNVRFSNLYISDREFNNYYPAMRFFGKRKDCPGQIFNMLPYSRRKKNGEKIPLFKPLKNGYLSDDIFYLKAKTKRVYHNAVKSGDASLYMQVCLCSGQYFTGSITAPSDKIKVLYELLKRDELKFGRSKTAQYSNCSVVRSSIKLEKAENEQLLLKKGTIAAAVLRSDVALVGKSGIEQTDIKSLVEKIGIKAALNSDTSIMLTSVSGYNSKWNMKKPRINAYKAGSVIVYDIDEDIVVSKRNSVIGEKQNEGFGAIEIIANADMLESQKPEGEALNAKENVITALIEKKNKADDIRTDAYANASKVKLNATQIGRLILMCKEAKDYEDLEGRVLSIKTLKTREDALLIIKLAKDKKVGVNPEWKDYLITLLTLAKYKIKAKGEQNNGN